MIAVIIMATTSTISVARKNEAVLSVACIIDSSCVFESTRLKYKVASQVYVARIAHWFDSVSTAHQWT